MLLHIEIVHIYLKKCKIIFQGKACKNKIGAGKTPGSVCRCVNTFSRISMRKRIFQQYHDSLFTRGPGGSDS